MRVYVMYFIVFDFEFILAFVFVGLVFSGGEGIIF